MLWKDTFGFKLDEDVTGIPALQPELRDQAAYYATLVNTGIIRQTKLERH